MGRRESFSGVSLPRERLAGAVSRNAPIRAAELYTPDFYRCLKGTMPRRSTTAQRLEAFLKAQQPPNARGD
jgi:hypothetical protein